MNRQTQRHQRHPVFETSEWVILLLIVLVPGTFGFLMIGTIGFFLLLPAIAFAGWLRQVRRAPDKATYGLRSRPDHCGCGYHLLGLASSGTCPECGRPYGVRRRSR